MVVATYDDQSELDTGTSHHIAIEILKGQDTATLSEYAMAIVTAANRDEFFTPPDCLGLSTFEGHFHQRESLVRRFFVERLAAISGIDAIYSTDDCDKLHVTVVVKDFWGEARRTVHDAIYNFRQRLDEPRIEFSIVPAEAERIDSRDRSDVRVLRGPTRIE